MTADYMCSIFNMNVLLYRHLFLRRFPGNKCRFDTMLYVVNLGPSPWMAILNSESNTL